MSNNIHYVQTAYNELQIELARDKEGMLDNIRQRNVYELSQGIKEKMTEDITEQHDEVFKGQRTMKHSVAILEVKEYLQLKEIEKAYFELSAQFIQAKHLTSFNKGEE